jgi:Arc/MetJ-type ribon-helix-helix transcriptional regulator
MMPKTKVAITLEQALLEQLDELVARGRFPNRSQAIEAAVADTLQRLAGVRLARECAKLDPAEEKALAEEGMGAELAAWPEY